MLSLKSDQMFSKETLILSKTSFYKVRTVIRQFLLKGVRIFIREFSTNRQEEVKVFKNGSSKISERQALEAVFHKFYLVHSCIPWPKC